MIGTKILNYKIESLLGEGGMGNVYLATHESLDRKVAVKSILPHLVENKEIKARFLNEAKTMSKLQHPNIVSLYDYYSGDEGLFLFMEYVEGKELHDYLMDLGKPLDEDLSRAFMHQILLAFQHAHKKGVVHRDIKPSNIIISNEGEIKILDFGIAKLLSDTNSNLTKTGTQVGTVYYMSPEQVEGQKVDHLSDIYSIGVTMYQLLTRVNPYKDCTTDFEIYKKITGEKLPDAQLINPSLSESIIDIIYKATEKDPKNRFQNCQEFINAFESSVGRAPDRDDKQSKKVLVSNRAEVVERKKKKRPIILIGIVSVLTMGALLWNLFEAEIYNYFYPDQYEEEYYEGEMEGDYDVNDESIQDVNDESIQSVQSDVFNGDTKNSMFIFLSSYYEDLNEETFDANNYYADEVDLFITKRNISPFEINAIISKKEDYLYSNGEVQYISSVTNNIGNSVSRFWMDYTCWRTARRQWQSCRIEIEVELNSDEEITSYRELQIEDLSFANIKPVKNTSFVTTRGKLVLNEECYTIFTGAQSQESNCVTWVDEKRNEGYNNPGYLWIPDYPSLSGSQSFATFTGIYSTVEGCSAALENFPSDQRWYYCKKISMSDGSNDPEDDEIRIR